MNNNNIMHKVRKAKAQISHSGLFQPKEKIVKSYPIGCSSLKKTELWDHQKYAIHACIDALRPGRRIMVQMPTGSGKNRVIAELVERLKNRQILIITPRTDLVKQTREYFAEHSYGVLSGNLGKDLGDGDHLIIGTYQTMINQAEIVPPDVIIIDECHFVPEDGDYCDLIARYPNASVIGLTATPYRGKKHIQECGLEWETVFGVSIVDMISKGILVPPISMATSDVPSLKEVLTADRLDDITLQIVPKLVHDVKEQRRKKNLVFCVDIRHMQWTAKLLREQGEKSVHVVHSNMTTSQKKAAIDRFTSTLERSWLLNVGLITTGINIPMIDCIVILRDVSSYSLLVQMIGRGLRLHAESGKKDCLVYDFGNGTGRFGFLDDPRFLEGTKHGTGGLHFKTCPTCQANVHIAVMTCQHCGHEFSCSSSLNELAVSRQLISSHFMALTYKSTHQHTNAQGNQIVEYQLEGLNGETYRAITAWAPGVPMRVPKYVQGASVLAHRIQADSDLVVIHA